MIGYIIAGILGYMVGDMNKPKSKKESKTKHDAFPYWIGIRFDEDADVDKTVLEFSTYPDAEKMWNKITDKKKISVKDILENSKSERDIKKYVEKQGSKYEPSGDQKIYSVSWGIGDKEFNEKTF